jgi:hypothetical protein
MIIVINRNCLFNVITLKNHKDLWEKCEDILGKKTVSRYFNLVLNAILRLHEILLKALEPVLEDCLDERWKLFKVLFVKIYFEILSMLCSFP